MADDLLTALQREWAQKKVCAKVESLDGLEVEVSPLTWDDKQALYNDGLKAWPELTLKKITRVGGEPLFGTGRNLGKILTQEVDPAIMQELLALLVDQADEDVEAGKPSSEEAQECT